MNRRTAVRYSPAALALVLLTVVMSNPCWRCHAISTAGTTLGFFASCCGVFTVRSCGDSMRLHVSRLNSRLQIAIARTGDVPERWDQESMGPLEWDGEPILWHRTGPREGALMWFGQDARLGTACRCQAEPDELYWFKPDGDFESHDEDGVLIPHPGIDPSLRAKVLNHGLEELALTTRR